LLFEFRLPFPQNLNFAVRGLGKKTMLVLCKKISSQI
jgi:hypothetical protein